MKTRIAVTPAAAYSGSIGQLWQAMRGMDIGALENLDDSRWHIPQSEGMRVPAVIFADRPLIEAMDDKVREQISNVARLPGIVGSAMAMPDAHWGYGFPIGGVAAMGTSSYVLAGTVAAERLSLSSACHGAGRAMSRHQAMRKWSGRQVVDESAVRRNGASPRKRRVHTRT